MKRVSLLIAVSVIASISSDAFAADHFARQRRAATARRSAAEQQHGHGHWGGPTTNRRWYPSRGGHGHTVIHRQIQLVPVYPYGYGFSNYGYRGWNPYYGSPYYRLPAFQHIHIHREIRE